MKILRESNDKKLLTAKAKASGEGVDDDEKEILQSEIELEEELQVAISELIGMLFKTHKGMTVGLAQYLITNLLPYAIGPQQSENTLKFGIFLIDDMVEFLGYEPLKEQWSAFGNTMMQFTSSSSVTLRQASCYGLGIYAISTPQSALSPEIAMKWIECLYASIRIPKGTEKEKEFGNCRDNIVAALGKIIKTHGNLFGLSQHLHFWLSYLPLRFDKPEALLQHEFLVRHPQTQADIMISHSELILGSTPETRKPALKRVLEIYGEVLSNAKIHNENIKTKMKNSLLKLNADQNFAAMSTEIWGTLSDRIKNHIHVLLK